MFICFDMRNEYDGCEWDTIRVVLENSDPGIGETKHEAFMNLTDSSLRDFNERDFKFFELVPVKAKVKTVTKTTTQKEIV